MLDKITLDLSSFDKFHFPRYLQLQDYLQQHNLGLENDPNSSFMFKVVADTSGALGLGLSHKQLSNYHPVIVDFADPSLSYRLKQHLNNESLIKACLHKDKPFAEQIIIDATCGTATDTAVLATSTAKIHCFERNPIVSLLLWDAINRAQLQEISIVNNLIPHFNDSIEFLSSPAEIINPSQVIDTIYLDPMFPVKGKSAAVKKEMQILQHLLESKTADNRDQLLLEQAQLFLKAKELKPRRIVVKRPNSAPFINGKSPSHQISSKKYRFDVYQL